MKRTALGSILAALALSVGLLAQTTPTDREFLESLRKQIDAHLNPPVNCVLGPEVIVSEKPLDACQPDNTQQVEVSWTKAILTQPSNGDRKSVV